VSCTTRRARGFKHIDPLEDTESVIYYVSCINTSFRD
jgi:hypothetical protein